MYLYRALAGAFALAATLAFGQADYPSKPVRIIVSFTAGGTTDVIARKLAERLTLIWKQPVVVENKPGAGGTLGTDYIVTQPADGYTLLMSSPGPIVVSPSLPKKLATDPLTAIVPVILVADVANVLVVSPEIGINSMQELVARGKAKPGELSYASTGVGTVAHLSGAQFSHMMGFEAIHVPYKGATAVTDLMAGRVAFMFATLPSVVGQIKGGKLKPLGQVAQRRFKTLPDVPTMKELGVEGMENGSWFGLFVVKGTPQPIIDRINAQVNAILKEKEVADYLDAQGADPIGGSPADYARIIRNDYEMWRPVIQRAKVEAN
jgi:tripartite-type tricarboxylate transporter receptor subunit TctC